MTKTIPLPLNQRNTLNICQNGYKGGGGRGEGGGGGGAGAGGWGVGGRGGGLL